MKIILSGKIVRFNCFHVPESELQYLSTTLTEDVKKFTAMPRDYQPQQNGR